MRIAVHNGTGFETVCRVINDLRSTPVVITDPETAEHGRYDAVMLLGGADINPAFYGQSKTYTRSTDPKRDRIEWVMAHRAIDGNLPMLGICRGCQMVAVAHGGILYQDIARETGIRHDRDRHQIKDIDPVLWPALPSSLSVIVNSYHHQAIKTVPAGFDVVARSNDGIVEAIYRPGVLGVQWHPELMVNSDREWMRLFRWFVVDKLRQ